MDGRRESGWVGKWIDGGIRRVGGWANGWMADGIK